MAHTLWSSAWGRTLSPANCSGGRTGHLSAVLSSAFQLNFLLCALLPACFSAVCCLSVSMCPSLDPQLKSSFQRAASEPLTVWLQNTFHPHLPVKKLCFSHKRRTWDFPSMTCSFMLTFLVHTSWNSLCKILSSSWNPLNPKSPPKWKLASQCQIKWITLLYCIPISSCLCCF